MGGAASAVCAAELPASSAQLFLLELGALQELLLLLAWHHQPGKAELLQKGSKLVEQYSGTEPSAEKRKGTDNSSRWR